MLRVDLFILPILFVVGNTNAALFGPNRWIPLQIQRPNQGGASITTTTTPAPGTCQECSTLARGCTNLNDCEGDPRICNTATTSSARLNSPLTRCYWPNPPIDRTCTMRATTPRCRCPNECPFEIGCTTTAQCTSGSCVPGATGRKCYWPQNAQNCGRRTGISDCLCGPP